MPNRVQWNSDYSVGNNMLDSQHKTILVLCNTLADCLVDANPDGEMKFNDTFTTLMVTAGEHFAKEQALLAGCGYPDLEEHLNEHDEFDYLANEIITKDNFENIELQRFLALWWTGHIVGSAKRYRQFLEGQPDA